MSGHCPGYSEHHSEMGCMDRGMWRTGSEGLYVQVILNITQRWAAGMEHSYWLISRRTSITQHETTPFENRMYKRMQNTKSHPSMLYLSYLTFGTGPACLSWAWLSHFWVVEDSTVLKQNTRLSIIVLCLNLHLTSHGGYLASVLSPVHQNVRWVHHHGLCIVQNQTRSETWEV